MWDIIIGGISAISIGAGVYYYLNRYNDNVVELLTFIHNDVKFIKYLYRGKKYIFMTYDLDCDINTIQKEIDVNSTEKDKIPDIDYKYFKVIITTPCECCNSCDKENIYFVNNIEGNNKSVCDNCECNKSTENNCTEISKKKCDDMVYEILLDAPKLLYSFVGPANTYYFAFDKDFNKKLTIFMNYLFQDNQVINIENSQELKHDGTLTYGRFSALFEPEKYFDFKVKINDVKKINSSVEWSIE